MESRLKENKELMNICQTTDVRIHSKHGLFQQILKEQPTQLRVLKEDIVKLSYSVKSLGMQNGEIGILTRRMPLRLKQKPIIKNTEDVPTQYNRHHVTHNSFFSNPLHTIKKDIQRTVKPVGFDFNYNPQIRHSQSSEILKVKPRISHSLKNLRRSQDRSESKTKAAQPSKSTRSYSQLLSQVHIKNIVKLEPLQGDSTLLQRIKKISGLTKVQLSSGKQAGKIAYLKNL